MANRVMKCVKSPSNGLTVMSVMFSYRDGKVVDMLTGGSLEGTLRITATDAKSFRVEMDPFVSITAVHASGFDGTLLHFFPSDADLHSRKAFLDIDVYRVEIDNSGEDPALNLVPNTGEYGCSLTIVAKNSKARP